MSRVDTAAWTTVAAFAFPLLLAAVMPIRALRPLTTALAPWAALPALLLAVGLRGRATVDWASAVFGVQLGAQGMVAQAFLLFTACLWLAAGLFARAYMAEDPHRPRFWLFFLATSSGNIGLVLARDVATFYLFYSLMTFAAYGMVVHDRTEAALRAGRVYLVMALAGEMLLLTAFFLIVGAAINIGLEDVPRALAASGHREILGALVLVGFGVKAGAILLHMWLPLAHPVAPTPASAVLSGAIIKAGLLGWLRFLPLGEVALPTHGAACVVAGASAAFYGVALGLTQRDPKTILAYSSISQMGFMTAAIGVGLSNPAVVPSVIAAIVFYATHHAVAKGALFLGTGVARATGSGWPGRLVTLGLLWPALDISGAPLSSGALAKISLKSVVEEASWGTTPLPWLLSVGAVASTVLMIHFLHRTIPRSTEPGAPRAGLWVPWASLLVLDLVLLARPPVTPEDTALLLHADKIWGAAWPVIMGVVVAAGVGVLRRRGARLRVRVPPGDLLYLVDAALPRLERAVLAAREAWISAPLRKGRALQASIARVSDRLLQAAERVEVDLAAFRTIGMLFLFGILVLAAQLLSTSMGGR
ncbi:complex I subunit 5 family protein [Sorangium sp. So ce1036]|uniref:complex I subunit 5 family protein n=1 Tax=Sorangium sp. So ce1036 TaxID=3133328 RepID=UPI003F058DEA